MALAERPGLVGLGRRHVEIAAPRGGDADLKTGCLVAGMAQAPTASMTWTLVRARGATIRRDLIDVAGPTAALAAAAWSFTCRRPGTGSNG